MNRVPAPFALIAVTQNDFWDFFFPWWLNAFLVSLSVKTPLNMFRQADGSNNGRHKALFLHACPGPQCRVAGNLGPLLWGLVEPLLCWQSCLGNLGNLGNLVPLQRLWGVYQQLWGCPWKESCWRSKQGSYQQWKLKHLWEHIFYKSGESQSTACPLQ